MTSGRPGLIGGKCTAVRDLCVPAPGKQLPQPRPATATNWPWCPSSRRGTVWSYTENRYAPPPPYPSPDPFEPFAVAAVELADEGLIVLGKVVEGTLAADLKVGMAASN